MLGRSFCDIGVAQSSVFSVFVILCQPLHICLFVEGHMAINGPVRHQKNSIWTEASEVHIIFFGDGLVRSDMNYLLYYTFIMSTGENDRNNFYYMLK
jgi:hypothetical protein